jgi:transposase
MAKPTSSEKRADIIKHMRAGETKENISKWLFVGIRTITRIWDKYMKTGSYEPNPPNSGRKPMVSEETMGNIVLAIKETPDMTLLETIDKFNLNISESALCRRLKKVGLTYKKRRFTLKIKTEKT